jgi:hypothetical protein
MMRRFANEVIPLVRQAVSTATPELRASAAE